MKNPPPDKITKEEKKTSESSFFLIYDLIQNWMRPSPKHPLVLQILIFVLKLPVLIVILALSPVVLLFMFITFVAAV